MSKDRAGASHRKVSLENMQFSGLCQATPVEDNLVVRKDSFHGYASQWVKMDWKWGRYAGLFGIPMPDLDAEIERMQERIEESVGIADLWIEEGFIYQLVHTNVQRLDFPEKQQVDEALSKGDALIVCQENSPIVQKVKEKLPGDAVEKSTKAFYLEADHRLFIITSKVKETATKFAAILENTVDLLSKYQLHKGWAGYSTGYYTITAAPLDHPIDAVAKALGEGCDWMLLSGYNEYMIPEPAKVWFKESDTPFLLLPGQSSSDGKAAMYRMKEYPNFQDSPLAVCIPWTKELNGLIFRRYYLSDKDINDADFDGYVLDYADKEHAEKENRPFVVWAGGRGEHYPTSMILFVEKTKAFTEESLFEAILKSRSVAVFPKAHLLGPAELVQAIGLLLLDRVYLEERFGDRIVLDAQVVEDHLKLTVINRYPEPVEGELSLHTSSALSIERPKKSAITIPPGDALRTDLAIRYGPQAAGKDNAIGVALKWKDCSVRTITHLNVPASFEMHSQLLDVPGEIELPITAWNHSLNDQVDFSVEAWEGDEKRADKDLKVNAPHAKPKLVPVKLDLKEGNYTIKVSGLGSTTQSQLVVKEQKGQASTRWVDFDNDGIKEVVMENDQIRALILPIGGRVIEYILKERDSNLFFKIWPKRPEDRKRAGRKREFWPYGGLEEFIGYPPMDGHTVFSCKVLKESGSYVRVQVEGEIHGNKVQKTFTLYADSPILEARIALNDMTPEMNVIGVNPLYELGMQSDTNDIYFFPTAKGIEERRVLRTRLYGECFHLNEGWVAGYDTEEDISLVTAFKVDDPFVMHMWQNTPDNTPTPYYYVELQPWVHVKQDTTTYFTYYMMGHSGHWKEALEKFKESGLLTKRR